MTVNQLVRLLKFNLGFRGVTQLDSTLKGGFAFGFNDILTVIGFVYQHADFLLRNLNDTTANSEKVELAIWVAFFVADGNRAWDGDRNKWLVARKNSDFTVFGGDHDFVSFLVDFFAKQGDKF